MKKQDTIPKNYARVTSVLNPYTNFSGIRPEVLEYAANRGERVHNYCEAYAKGLFLAEIDEDCKNYVEAFERWFDKAVVEVLQLEIRMNCPVMRLSGKCDMIVKIKGDDHFTMVDLKTPLSESKTYRLQTAAYVMLAKSVLNIDCERRMCLMLPKKDAKAKVAEQLDIERDSKLFTYLLELHHFFNPIIAEKPS